MATNEAHKNQRNRNFYRHVAGNYRWNCFFYRALRFSSRTVFFPQKFSCESNQAPASKQIPSSRSLCVHSKGILLRRTSTSTFSYRPFIKKTEDNLDNERHQPAGKPQIFVRLMAHFLSLVKHTFPDRSRRFFLFAVLWRNLRSSRSSPTDHRQGKNVSQLKMQTHDDGVTVHGAISLLFIPRGCFIIIERKMSCLLFLLRGSKASERLVTMTWREERDEATKNEVGSILNERMSTRSDLWRRIFDWVAFLPVSKEFHKLSDFLSRFVVYKKKYDFMTQVIKALGRMGDKFEGLLCNSRNSSMHSSNRIRQLENADCLSALPVTLFGHTALRNDFVRLINDFMTMTKLNSRCRWPWNLHAGNASREKYLKISTKKKSDEDQEKFSQRAKPLSSFVWRNQSVIMNI